MCVCVCVCARSRARTCMYVQGVCSDKAASSTLVRKTNDAFFTSTRAVLVFDRRNQALISQALSGCFMKPIGRLSVCVPVVPLNDETSDPIVKQLNERSASVLYSVRQSLSTCFINPFTTMLAAPSVGRRPIKVTNLKSLRPFPLICMNTSKDFYQNALC